MAPTLGRCSLFGGVPGSLTFTSVSSREEGVETEGAEGKGGKSDTPQKSPLDRSPPPANKNKQVWAASLWLKAPVQNLVLSGRSLLLSFACV